MEGRTGLIKKTKIIARLLVAIKQAWTINNV